MKTHSQIMDSEMKLTSCPIMPTYGAPSVMFVKGKGTELWDQSDNRYLDFVGGLAVQSLGHANPEIAEVLANQASKLTQVSNYWATEHAHHVAIQLDKAITGRLKNPKGETYTPLGQVFFCNSGSEANDTMVKMLWMMNARIGKPKKRKIIFSDKTKIVKAVEKNKSSEKKIRLKKNLEGIILLDNTGYNRIYRTSIALWKDQPIFGSGLKSFRIKCWEIIAKNYRNIKTELS